MFLSQDKNQLNCFSLLLKWSKVSPMIEIWFYKCFQTPLTRHQLTLSKQKRFFFNVTCQTKIIFIIKTWVIDVVFLLFCLLALLFSAIVTFFTRCTSFDIFKCKGTVIDWIMLWEAGDIVSHWLWWKRVGTYSFLKSGVNNIFSKFIYFFAYFMWEIWSIFGKHQSSPIY